MTSTATIATVSSIADAQDVVRSSQFVVIHGAQTKPNLAAHVLPAQSINMTGLTGIVEYLPEEYTFTAMAGTRLSDIADVLAENGQYMPFDPPLVESGGTLGGTVAAGLSGARRYRYGGVRDFIVGLRFVDGSGNLVRGGGKVVKNAAGFDFPKLFVGSAGAYGAIVEVSFKVFPEPSATRTVRIDYADTAAAAEGLCQLSGAAYDIDALDLEPNASGASSLWIRLGGLDATMAARCERLVTFTGHGEVVPYDEARDFWRSGREFEWVNENAALVKVPVTPIDMPVLDARLHTVGARRRYSVGGNVAWIAWPEPLKELHNLLTDLQHQGLVLRAAEPARFIGAYQPSVLAKRVKQALDPNGRFPEL